jgi:hypothetical protein
MKAAPKRHKRGEDRQYGDHTHYEPPITKLYPIVEAHLAMTLVTKMQQLSRAGTITKVSIRGRINHSLGRNHPKP